MRSLHAGGALEDGTWPITPNPSAPAGSASAPAPHHLHNNTIRYTLPAKLETIMFAAQLPSRVPDIQLPSS
jgi:hypothetical protein